MEVMIPDWIGTPQNIGALASLRCGGVSKSPYDDGQGGGGLNVGLHVGDNAQDVQRNRTLLSALSPGEPVWLSQVHGAVVVDAANVKDGIEADASFTTQPGVVCAIQTADCLPVLLSDAKGRVVAAAHAGWRGLAAGVLENTVTRMADAGADEIIAWLGPAIGPLRFEVGVEVVATFMARDSHAQHAFRAIPGPTGKFLADIYQLARIMLMRAGVEKISGGGLCTMTDSSKFYSYRRDKITGRMASMIWIKPTSRG